MKRARPGTTAGSVTRATVAGVVITHPDRVVFPALQITKLELAQYYARVAPLMLPHVAGRPLALVRCPDGVGKQCFFQKHWAGTPPPAIDTVPILQHDGTRRRHVVIHSATGLVTLAQWGVIEIHPWGCRADDANLPDRIVFDLDPAPGVAWSTVQGGARQLHRLLGGQGLDSWLKTSGGKGLHVVVPIARRPSWDDVSAFARAIAEQLQAAFPDRFLTKASKSARRGRVFIDWLRNSRGATSVAPWSPRARPSAGVSVPLPWPRLGHVGAGDQYTVTSVRVPSADPWRELLTAKQALTKEMLRRLI